MQSNGQLALKEATRINSRGGIFSRSLTQDRNTEPNSFNLRLRINKAQESSSNHHHNNLEERPLSITITKSISSSSNGSNGRTQGSRPLECRICYDDDRPEDMASPCECSGSIKYVHKTCLGSWINSSKSTKCSMCLREYNNTVKIERKYRHITLWGYFLEDEIPTSEFAILVLGICQIIYCLNAVIYGHLLVFVWLVATKMNLPTQTSLNPFSLIYSVFKMAEHTSSYDQSSSSSSVIAHYLSTLAFVVRSSYDTQLGILLWILDVVVIFGFCVGACVIWDVLSEYRTYLRENFVVEVR